MAGENAVFNTLLTCATPGQVRGPDGIGSALTCAEEVADAARQRDPLSRLSQQ